MGYSPTACQYITTHCWRLLKTEHSTFHQHSTYKVEIKSSVSGTMSHRQWSCLGVLSLAAQTKLHGCRVPSLRDDFRTLIHMTRLRFNKLTAIRKLSYITLYNRDLHLRLHHSNEVHVSMLKLKFTFSLKNTSQHRLNLRETIRFWTFTQTKITVQNQNQCFRTDLMCLLGCTNLSLCSVNG